MSNIYKPPESRVADRFENNSGGGKDIEIPDGVKGWSWGACLLNWIWGLGNRTWISLLCLVPYVGLVMSLVLGYKGREWAWRNKRWDSLEHFQRVQRLWSIWGIVITVLMFGAAILMVFLMMPGELPM